MIEPLVRLLVEHPEWWLIAIGIAVLIDLCTLAIAFYLARRRK